MFFQSPSSTLRPLEKKMSDEVDRPVEVGVTLPVPISNSTTLVSSGMRYSWGIELCVGFSLTVMVAAKREQYPLPQEEDIFAAFSGAEVLRTFGYRTF